MGRPAFVNPHGIEMAGRPVAVLGLVFLEVKPAPGPRTRCSTPPPETVSASMRQAATGAEGVHQQVYLLEDPGVLLLNDALDLQGLGIVPAQDELAR